jgi:hypothetical protein
VAEVGGNGVYHNGASSFPDQSQNGRNYWVDVDYVKKDTTPPTVSAVSPANGTTNVLLATAITVTFSEAMDASTINSNTILLQSASGATVAANVAYNATTFTATLTPTSSLAQGVAYTVVVRGGAGAPVVRDTSANALAADFTSTFTTLAATAPTVTQFAPAGGAIGVPLATAVTVTFSEAMDPSTINANTVQLRTAAGGTVSAVVSYDANTFTARLTPNISLAYSTGYVVVVHGGTGTAVVRDVAGSPLAADFTSTFTTVADTTPPTVSLVSPANAATNVPLTTTVTVKFSEAMDATTINANTILLKTFGGVTVAASVTYNASTMTATLTPSASLAGGAPYAVDVLGGSGTAVKDLAGNALATDFTSTFTTASANTAAPAAPQNLFAAGVSQSEVKLIWDLGDTTDTAVVIERKTGVNGIYQALAILPEGDDIFTDTSCWAGTTYFYRIKARNAGGDSAYCSERPATTLAVPAGGLALVTNFHATVTSPTSVAISFTDTNTAINQVYYLLERSDDGTSYRLIASLGTGASFQDFDLTPGNTYYYRVRGASNYVSSPVSDYTQAISVTAPTRAVGAPIEPSALQSTANTATTVTLSWTNNDPSNPATKIERAAVDPWHPMTMNWTQVAITAAGANTFTDTGLVAESAYAYRVRATNAVGDSSYAMPENDVMVAVFGNAIGVTTASAGTGSPKLYDIGPGQAYQNIGDLNWSVLGPGDTVNIHYKPGGYHEIFQVSTRGTAYAWITINGVPDSSTGALPVIDGVNAVLAPQFQNHWAPLSGYGGLVIGARPGYSVGYKPGFIQVQNLQFQNFYSAYTFTDFDGTVKPYGYVGAGIYIERGDHITLKNNIVNANGEGVFGAGQSTYDRLMTDITLDSNSIYGNGNIGRDHEHNTYIEGINTLYQFNRYGPLRAGSLGAELKDRSAGLIIRDNFIEGGAHELQLPEAQNQSDLAMVLTEYHQTFVYGNTLIAYSGASPVYYGGDQGLAPFYRKGVLYLYNNTIVSISDQSAEYKINAVSLADVGESLDARDNILTSLPKTPGATPTLFGLLGAYNYAYFGANYVTSRYQPTTSNDYTFHGYIGGLQNLILGLNDPGFVNAYVGDFQLLGSSPAMNAETRLSGSTYPYPVAYEYVDPHAGKIRTSLTDLGAFEYVV